jgi:hypothetical protein
MGNHLRGPLFYTSLRLPHEDTLATSLGPPQVDPVIWNPSEGTPRCDRLCGTPSVIPSNPN